MRMIESDKVAPLFRLLLMSYPKNVADSMCEDIQAIVDVHTVDAVPVVRGEWGFRSNGHNITRIGDYEEWHECSVCKLSADYPSSYCPNCGAKMESEGST